MSVRDGAVGMRKRVPRKTKRGWPDVKVKISPEFLGVIHTGEVYADMIHAKFNKNKNLPPSPPLSNFEVEGKGTNKRSPRGSIAAAGRLFGISGFVV